MCADAAEPASHQQQRARALQLCSQLQRAAALAQQQQSGANDTSSISMGMLAARSSSSSSAGGGGLNTARTVLMLLESNRQVLDDLPKVRWLLHCCWRCVFAVSPVLPLTSVCALFPSSVVYAVADSLQRQRTQGCGHRSCRASPEGLQGSTAAMIEWMRAPLRVWCTSVCAVGNLYNFQSVGNLTTSPQSSQNSPVKYNRRGRKCP